MFWTIFFAVILAFVVIKIILELPEIYNYFKQEKQNKRQEELAWKRENNSKLESKIDIFMIIKDKIKDYLIMLAFAIILLILFVWIGIYT